MGKRKSNLKPANVFSVADFNPNQISEQARNWLLNYGKVYHDTKLKEHIYSIDSALDEIETIREEIKDGEQYREEVIAWMGAAEAELKKLQKTCADLDCAYIRIIYS